MEFIVSYNSAPEIKIFDNIELLAEFIGIIWIDQIQNLESNNFYSLALSGGSTPIKIFQYLSTNYKNRLNWNRIKFFWGDERCVPPDNNDSNYKLAKEILFEPLNISEENIFRILGEENPVDESDRYSKVLQTELCSRNGIPKFDFILLGMGEDGHTASIFPQEINLFHSHNFCQVAEHPISSQKRITLTGKIINNASTIAIAAIGESKAKKIFDVVKRNREADPYPVSLVNPLEGKLYWLLDKESASLI